MTWITATTISITFAYDTARIGGTTTGVNIHITRVEAGNNRGVETCSYDSTSIIIQSLYNGDSTSV